MTASSPQAPQATASSHHQGFWLWVMCLTGVDYFSTLGYLPSIAYEVTGRLAPLATVFLVVVTLGGALPVYAYVAGRSPHGMGSVSMLERLVRGWTGKFLILTLLGFVGTAFIMTKTLSAADAAVHLIDNPLMSDAPALLRDRVLVTMILLMILGAMFLRGFREVISLAVVIVGVYLTLNLIIIGSGVIHLAAHPDKLNTWYEDVRTGNWHLEDAPFTPTEPDEAEVDAVSVPRPTWSLILLTVVVLFPRLALGLSGFETGLMVMPLIRGRPDDDPGHPQGRIRNTRKLLATAALIMSFYLLGSALVVNTLIPPTDLDSGRAVDRALAYLAHGEAPEPISPLFGEVFGTIYDLSTIVILWFAGASAMAGLLNLVPQYLPRYGMAPEWARAVRPLVVLFTAINLLVTWIFDASVLAQSAAYATGVLVFLASGCLATLIDRWQSRAGRFLLFRIPWHFGLVTLIFFYATGAIMVEQPAGLLIALAFIVAIMAASLVSRLWRSTELRFAGFEFADNESRFLWDAIKHLEWQVLVPHRPGGRDLASKEASIRKEHRIAADIPIVFIEAELGDPSEFYQSPRLQVTQEQGRFIIRVTHCVSIAHVLAAIGLELSKVGKPPELHFGWSDESPLAANVDFLLFGQGNIPWMVRELILKAEPNPDRQPRVIIG